MGGVGGVTLLEGFFFFFLAHSQGAFVKPPHPQSAPRHPFAVFYH